MARTKQQLVEDRLWELIDPLIPLRPAARGPGGQPRIDDRVALKGILFVLHRLALARPAPTAGCGCGHTTWQRLRAWQADGVWNRLHQLLRGKKTAPMG